ncbi:hypothetical protein FB451DRAFT_1241923 [Mycena latifolia]|nr:hypothetical protein FB451DRAFT_1241923 [Mycena latifolia]
MLLCALILSSVATVLATFPTQLVYQSPTGFFLENIGVRPSGKLLLTSVLSPTLHTLDPAKGNATLDEVYTFPNSTCLTGIAEYAPDVYALVASNLNITTRRAEPGSVAIWRLDFSAKHFTVTRIAMIPQSTLINGLSTVPGAPDLVLAADSAIGAAYEINMRTGAVRVAIQDTALAPHAPAPALGINGLRVRGNALYFTNSALQTFARVPLSMGPRGIHKAGAVQVLGTVQSPLPAGKAAFDDFALDCAGRAWVTMHPGALTLLFPLANGTWAQENAAGDPAGSYAVFTEPTLAAFGRAEGEEKMLYVVTGGGQVVRVDTAGVHL